MLNEQFLFTEKYRPKKINDCILPGRLKSTFQKYVSQQKIPNLLLTGSPGIGKTSVAKALCDEVAGDFMIINGSEERGIDTLRTKVKSYATSLSLTGDRKVIIIDEADYLTPEAQAAFRGIMEETAENCSFIFTCNYKAKLIEAIHSRCSVIEFKLKNGEKVILAKEFLIRLKDILEKENIKYDIKVLVEIIQKHFPDFRRTLNEIQRYSVHGNIDIGILAQVVDVNLKDLMKMLKEKNFGNVRKWVATNSDVDPARIYRQIYDSLYEYLEPISIPSAVILLGEYQFKAAFCMDGEINLVACLTEIMSSCNFT